MFCRKKVLKVVLFNNTLKGVDFLINFEDEALLKMKPNKFTFNPLMNNVPKWSDRLAANAARFLKCV